MQKLSDEILKLLNEKSTQEFLKISREFISLIENKKITKKDFYHKIHKKLAELYSAGLSLKRINLVYSNEKTNYKTISRKKLLKNNINLISSLGEDCFYWEIIDPTQKSKPTQEWLVDDISDIYADLKEELYKIDQIGTDEAIEDALWHLKFGFNSHWGNHCVNAVRALHYIYYEGKETM